jgi:hypothetical protein
MVESPAFWLTARYVLLLAGLIVPGAVVLHALRLPATLALSFVGSTLALYVTVLVLQLFDLPISLGALVTGLLGFVVIARLAGRRRDAVAESSSLLARDRRLNPLTGMGAWLPLYLLFWVAVLWRAWHEPLAGPDTEFRWSFLAEQMLRLRTLDFYPPRSAADFVSYFWVESIPPGAATLHAWAYACAGSTNAAWTIPAVVLQLWTLHDLLWQTAGRFGGPLAARCACFGAAACSLLTWSVLIGQETGLTALALVGIVFALHTWSETRNSGWAALAGIFAAVGASAREYGLVFPILAVAGLLALRAPRPAWFAFLSFAVIGIWWPLRTWLLTGNPFYSLPVGESLPVNERFIAWIEHDAEAFGAVLRTPAGWSNVARYLIFYAPTAVAGWLAIIAFTLRGRRDAGLTLVALIAVLGLWAASVRYTNGGLFYSLRVTSPALALGALAAGVVIAAWMSAQPRVSWITKGAAGLLIVVLAMATLALPQNPWTTPRRQWPAFVRTSPTPRGTADETVALTLRALSGPAGGDTRTRGVVVADGPGFQRRFLPTGVSALPLWSPQVDWLFDAQLTPAEAARQWRESRVSHIIVTKWQANLDFFNAHSRWARAPFQVQLVGETNATAIFAIRAVE